MIINGNNIEELKKFDDNYFDSIVTDPPYEIGFMGKSWDASGIANNPEMWAECLRVLKPGGYLLSFSATRTYHRMAVAIEDSGFEIRDMIEWVYGSGFPKSRNIGKDMEKKEVGGIKNLKQIGTKKGIKVETGTQGFSYSKEYVAGKSMGGRQISGEIPVYEINNSWGGWGTALKPAHEPICMARKPLSEKTVAENCLKYGTGGINIDESRVGTEEMKAQTSGKTSRAYQSEETTTAGGIGEDKIGRFPANLIHDNSEEVRECFPETNRIDKRTSCKSSTGMFFEDSKELNRPQDSGGNASRFFKSIIYQAKASKSERGTANSHPTVKPIALMEYLIKMVTPTNGIVLDPFMGSGSTGVACVLNDFEFVGIDLDKDYCEIARARIEGVKETQTKMF
jgi:DNA modification methylase